MKRKITFKTQTVNSYKIGLIFGVVYYLLLVTLIGTFLITRQDLTNDEIGFNSLQTTLYIFGFITYIISLINLYFKTNKQYKWLIISNQVIMIINAIFGFISLEYYGRGISYFLYIFIILWVASLISYIIISKIRLNKFELLSKEEVEENFVKTIKIQDYLTDDEIYDRQIYIKRILKRVTLIFAVTLVLIVFIKINYIRSIFLFVYVLLIWYFFIKFIKTVKTYRVSLIPLLIFSLINLVYIIINLTNLRITLNIEYLVYMVPWVVFILHIQIQNYLDQLALLNYKMDYLNNV